MTLGKHWAAVIALCLAAQAYPATTGRNTPHSPLTARFTPSGYSLTVSTLPPGTYTVVVYARSVATGTFSVARSVQVFVN